MSIHRTISITTLSTNQNSSLLFSSGQRHGWRISFLVRIIFLSPRFNQSKYFISHSTSTLVIIPCSYKVLNKISPSKSYILTISNPDFPGHFFFCILHVSIPPYSPLMSSQTLFHYLALIFSLRCVLKLGQTPAQQQCTAYFLSIFLLANFRPI